MRCEFTFAAPTWMVSSISSGIIAANTPQTLQVIDIINTAGANKINAVYLSQWEATHRPEIPSVAQTMTDANVLQRSSAEPQSGPPELAGCRRWAEKRAAILTQQTLVSFSLEDWVHILHTCPRVILQQQLPARPVLTLLRQPPSSITPWLLPWTRQLETLLRLIMKNMYFLWLWRLAQNSQHEGFSFCCLVFPHCNFSKMMFWAGGIQSA